MHLTIEVPLRIKLFCAVEIDASSLSLFDDWKKINFTYFLVTDINISAGFRWTGQCAVTFVAIQCHIALSCLHYWLWQFLFLFYIEMNVAKINHVYFKHWWQQMIHVKRDINCWLFVDLPCIFIMSACLWMSFICYFDRVTCENAIHNLRSLCLSLINIWRCRRSTLCRSRWSPYH